MSFPCLLVPMQHAMIHVLHTVFINYPQALGPELLDIIQVLDQVVDVLL